MDNTKEHQALVKEILLEASKLSGVRLFPRRVGLATPVFTSRPVYFGVNGEADLQGFMRWYLGPGRFIAAYIGVEVKTGASKLSEAQVKWKNMFIKHGGIYIEARSVKQFLEEINKELLFANRQRFVTVR